MHFNSKFFFFSFTTNQDYFNHFEMIQSLGGAKTGEKTTDHPQQRTGLTSHVPRKKLKPTVVR